MGKETGISWTDATFNPWWGCTKVSPGCDLCYAEAFDKRVGGDHWGKDKPRRTMSDSYWYQPLLWNRNAQAEGKKVKVFCASMADVMDDETPSGQRERLWDLIDHTPYLIWQLLTKRPQRYFRYLPTSFAHNNVWLGTTAEDQHFYDIRWSSLRLVAADYGLTSWISYEPALGPIVMDDFPFTSGIDGILDYPNWIIFGGESGADKKRRPMDIEWARDLKSECASCGTSFFMKQMGARTSNAAKALIPVDMLVHEFPAVQG